MHVFCTIIVVIQAKKKIPVVLFVPIYYTISKLGGRGRSNLEMYIVKQMKQHRFLTRRITILSTIPQRPTGLYKLIITIVST